MECIRQKPRNKKVNFCENKCYIFGSDPIYVYIYVFVCVLCYSVELAMVGGSTYTTVRLQQY